MTESVLQSNVMAIVSKFGDLGVFVGMFLESSIMPIPSEVVIVGAGAIGVPVLSILIFGSVGATLGSMVGYALGRYAAMPVILKYGRFILIKPHHIAKAEAFAKKYGGYSVLLGRVLPIVPFKVFSIAAGITKIPFWTFIICTLIGVVPRIFLLSIFGSALVKYTKPSLLIVAGIITIAVAVKLAHEFYKNGRKNHERKKV
ncbi:MAG: DedA family protein [Candidatus Omnitrophica bacterium]|nr:DedA family protein [Candidatus Omnitrophota bacterium]